MLDRVYGLALVRADGVCKAGKLSTPIPILCFAHLKQAQRTVILAYHEGSLPLDQRPVLSLPEAPEASPMIQRPCSRVGSRIWAAYQLPAPAIEDACDPPDDRYDGLEKQQDQECRSSCPYKEQKSARGTRAAGAFGPSRLRIVMRNYTDADTICIGPSQE